MDSGGYDRGLGVQRVHVQIVQIRLIIILVVRAPRWQYSYWRDQPMAPSVIRCLGIVEFVVIVTGGRRGDSAGAAFLRSRDDRGGEVQCVLVIRRQLLLQGSVRAQNVHPELVILKGYSQGFSRVILPFEPR